jgi:parallel beta-helix repeat protein
MTQVSAQDCLVEPEIFTYYNVPGNYQLDSDINYAGTCILINGSGITLDGMGHTLSGVTNFDCKPYGIVVYGNNENNIHISNLTVTDKFAGVAFYSVNKGSISNVHALLNNKGILISPGSEIDVSNNSIEENTLVEWSPNNPTGMFVESSQNINVRGNSFIRNKDGLAVHYGSQNNISDNIFTEQSHMGIHLEAEQFTFISNNTLNDNLMGMWFLGSNDITAHNNTLKIGRAHV